MNVTIELDADKAVATVPKAVVSSQRFAPLAVVCGVSEDEARRQIGRFRDMTLGTTGIAVVGDEARDEMNETSPKSHLLPEHGVRLFLPQGWGPVDDSECVVEGQELVHPGAWSRMAEVAQRWSGWMDVDSPERTLDEFWSSLLDESWGYERIATVRGGQAPGAPQWLTPSGSGHSGRGTARGAFADQGRC